MPSRTTPTIRLRTTQFDQAAQARGWTTSTQIADGIGIDRTTVSRIRRALTSPGEAFIAAALAAFGQPFEDLFEIGETNEIEDADERHTA